MVVAVAVACGWLSLVIVCLVSGCGRALGVRAGSRDRHIGWPMRLAVGGVGSSFLSLFTWHSGRWRPWKRWHIYVVTLSNCVGTTAIAESVNKVVQEGRATWVVGDGGASGSHLVSAVRGRLCRDASLGIQTPLALFVGDSWRVWRQAVVVSVDEWHAFVDLCPRDRRKPRQDCAVYEVGLVEKKGNVSA